MIWPFYLCFLFRLKTRKQRNTWHISIFISILISGEIERSGVVTNKNQDVLIIISCSCWPFYCFVFLIYFRLHRMMWGWMQMRNLHPRRKRIKKRLRKKWRSLSYIPSVHEQLFFKLAQTFIHFTAGVFQCLTFTIILRSFYVFILFFLLDQRQEKKEAQPVHAWCKGNIQTCNMYKPFSSILVYTTQPKLSPTFS